MRAVTANKVRNGLRLQNSVSLFTLCCVLLAGCSIVPVTRPVVKIGLVAPFEGPYRYVGYDAIFAARLALREANASGGVEGYAIELVAFDDQGTIGGARMAARSLVLDSQLVAVIGHYRNDTTEAARWYYDEAGVPLLVAGTVEGDTAAQDMLLCGLLDYVKNEMSITVNNGSSTPHVQWVNDDENVGALGCAGGLRITVSSQLPPGSSVDVILLTQDPIAAGETLVALRRTEWDGIVVGGSTLNSPLFSNIADPAGVVFVLPHRIPDVDGTDAVFATSYQSLGPHVPRPGQFALTTHETTQALLAALESTIRKGEDPTRPALAAQVAQPPQSMGFIYRWTPQGTVELVKKLIVTNND